MKRKGFTLVELLAVIVILAVISIITVPMIGNVIEDSKKKALEQSVYGIVESANYFALTNTGVHEFLFDETKQGETINGKTLNYTGSVDAEGNLYIDKDGSVSLCLMNEDYYVYKNYNSGIVVGNRKEDSCKAEYDPLTNKYIAYLESEGTGSNVYSKEEVNNLVDGLETKIENNSTSINAITGIVSTNKSNIEAIQSKLDKYALQEDLDTTNSNVSNINNQVSTNTSDIASLNTQIGNLATTSNVEAVNTLANKNKTDIANIQSQLGSMATTSNIESLNTLINTNKNNISTNATSITSLQNSVNDLSSELISKQFLQSNMKLYSSILEWAIANPNTYSLDLSYPFSDGSPVTYGKYWSIGSDLYSTGITVFSQQNNSNKIYTRVLAENGWVTEWEEIVLKSDLDNLERSLTSVGVDITPNSLITNVTFRKSGNVVQILFGQTTVETGYGQTITIANIPEEFIPRLATNGIIPITVNGEHYSMYVSVNSGGTLAVRFLQSIPAGIQLYGLFTYML